MSCLGKYCVPTVCWAVSLLVTDRLVCLNRRMISFFFSLAVVNGIVVLILVSLCSLLVYGKLIDFVFYLVPSILAKLTN